MTDGNSGGSLAEQVARMPLARRILLGRRLAEAGIDAPELPILPVPRHEGAAYDLSFAQHGLWLVEQLQTDHAAYNLAVAARLEGRLDPTALRRSFDLLAKRHEGLRVQLAVLDGRPVQRVASQPETELSFASVDGFSEAVRSCAEEARRPFDLTRGPLWRATLIRLGEDDHAIVMVIHHMLSDNWSMGIFARELEVCYGALTRGEPIAFPELPIQCIDVAAWQRRLLETGRLDEELSYWRRRLHRAPPAPQLRTDRARPRVQSYTGARRYFTFSSGLRASLHRLGLSEGVTPFMILVATLQALLHRHTGEDRIVVGTDVAGRGRAELEGLIGFFANQVVLCTDLSGNPTLRDLLARVRDVCVGAQANQEVPFSKVVEAVNPARSLDRTPLFQVKIDFLQVPMGAVSLPGLDVSPIMLEGTAKFDLELILWDARDGIQGFIEYSTDLFDAVTIDTMIDQLVALLEQCVTDPGQRVLDVPLAGERRGALSFDTGGEFSFDP